MKKKILLVFIALLIFYMPLSSNHQKVDAVAVASKVVNAGAKKVAKEMAKDTAVQMSMNMVMNYKYTPKDKTPKEGYSFICMPKDKISSGECAKPMEIKSTLSTADKQQLETKIESNLDKKIAGGIGATRWGKFLDWFVPIFSIGMGAAVIDYAMNGDVSDLFDDLAYDSLVELGLVVDEVGNTDRLKGTTVTGKNKGYNGAEFVVTLNADNQFFQYENKTYKSVNVNVQNTWDSEKKAYLFSGVFTKIGSTTIYTGRPTSDIKAYSSTAYTFDEGEAKAVLSLYPFQLPPITNQMVEPEKWDQLELPRTNKEGTPMKVPAPGSLPFTKTDTGEVLYPFTKPDGTTGYKTKTGLIVGEDNVTVGNPVITENPDGSKTIKKQPTVTTPNPSPEEDGKIPPKDDEITEEDLEGMSCTRLKKPDFKPLTNAFTTSFPFSIPWDLWRVIEAVFGNMGTQKPVIYLDFIAENIKLEIPDYFDSWVEFAKSITLIGFDIGLIYLFYRFMKGGSD